MLYLICFLLATIAVILVFINAKLKLVLEWLKVLDSKCETLWTISRTLHGMGQIDKKP
jgi:hypothetical protein